MNCDQVFDILTRGPFPTGTACDPLVEAHLSGCAECHRLAEALRPALELFQEAVGPEESRDLPGYWCAVAAESKSQIVSYAESEPVQSRPLAPRGAEQRAWSQLAGRRYWSALTVWRMAAMLALGVTMGLLVNSRGSFDELPPVTIATGALPPAGKPQLSKAMHMELAALPAACFRHVPHTAPRNSIRGDQLLANADLDKLSCCSDCHNANSDTVPKSATALVAKRCELCHAE